MNVKLYKITQKTLAHLVTTMKELGKQEHGNPKQNDKQFGSLELRTRYKQCCSGN